MGDCADEKAYEEARKRMKQLNSQLFLQYRRLVKALSGGFADQASGNQGPAVKSGSLTAAGKAVPMAVVKPEHRGRISLFPGIPVSAGQRREGTLQRMRRAGASLNQIVRLTGTSMALVRKTVGS